MFDPAQKLGRKGLLYKDQATKLALCAVQEALIHAGLSLQGTEESHSTGVVVSSNLGNIDTVCRMVQTVHQGSTRDLSPMDGPNASSNVIASTIAIRFHCQALNLMLCNGSTSGLDALYIAVNAIKARRACRMLVVGVEPHNDVVQQLMTRANTQEPIRAAAACLILEAAEQAAARGATVYGTLSGYRSSPVSSGADIAIISALQADSSSPSLWLVPDLTWPENRSLVNKVLAARKATPPEILDLGRSLGELYGTQGVLQCVVACLWRQRHATASEGGVVLVTCGGTWGDGIASIFVKNATKASWRG
jgi:3-oxoacyl-[acyl-carrier-protein] synthase II